MLPDGWAQRTVSEICEMQNGHGFGPEDWGTEGLPIIRIQNLNGGKNFDFYSGPAEPRWVVEPGQLLFAWAGTKGVSFGPTIWRGERGVLNQHIFKVHAKPGIDREWLYWALRHVTDRIEANAHGFKATLVHVKKSDIERQVVFVPDLPAQQQMAAALRVWDEAVTTTEKLLANSRMQKQVLMHTLLMGRARRQGYAISGRYATTKIGQVPEDWKHVPIGELAKEVSQKNGERHALPVLSCTKHKGLVDSLTYFKKRVFSEDTSTYKLVPRGCFAYATNHIDEGSIGYQNLYDRALISPMYTVFSVREQVDHGFLFKLLKSDHYRQVFAANTNASVDRRGGLRWSDFKKIEIPLPSTAEQRAISEVIDTAEEDVRRHAARVEVLQKEKRSLMADLLTGRRRVRLPAAETTP